MTRAVEKIDWVRDESIVVERLKTGELPPADVQVDESPGNFLPYFFFHFQFQDMSDIRSDRERKSSSLSRRISR